MKIDVGDGRRGSPEDLLGYGIPPRSDSMTATPGANGTSQQPSTGSHVGPMRGGETQDSAMLNCVPPVDGAGGVAQNGSKVSLTLSVALHVDGSTSTVGSVKYQVKKSS